MTAHGGVVEERELSAVFGGQVLIVLHVCVCVCVCSGMGFVPLPVYEHCWGPLKA